MSKRTIQVTTRTEVINSSACPACGAGPGEPCLGVERRNGARKPRKRCHAERWNNLDVDQGESLPHRGPDALSLLLALEQQPWRFEKAAPRWHARLCDQAQLTLAQLALAALYALAGPGAVGGGQALVAVCSAHGLDDAVGVLDGWLDSHD